MPKNPLFLKRFGDTSLPFSKENAPNRRNLTFSKEIITFLKPELTQSRQSRWELGAFWDPKWRRTRRQTGRQRERERETDSETDKETDQETDG